MKLKGPWLKTAVTVVLAGFGAAGMAYAECGNNNDEEDCEDDCCEEGSEEGANRFLTYTGDVRRKVRDLEVWGGVGKHQLVWERRAQSRGIGNGVFGQAHSWRHSYDYQMVSFGTHPTTGAPQLEIRFPNGRQTVYTRDNANPANWYASARVGEYLSVSGTTYTLKTRNGWEYAFQKKTDSQGAAFYQLQSFRCHWESSYTLTYDSAERLTRITEPAGRYLEITYGLVPGSDLPFTTLAEIAATPPAGQWTDITVNDPNTYRYLRYKGWWESHCNVAEIEFYTEINGVETKLTGTPFGTSPAANAGEEYDKAFDGSTLTYVNAFDNAAGFTGIDLGAGNAARVTKIRIYPRAGYAARMKSGVFAGSNETPITDQVITQVATSDGRSVTYDYDVFSDPIYPQDYVRLIAANYGDGTSAYYTYDQIFAGLRPLMVSAVDPRCPERAVNMQYEYYLPGSGEPIGYIHKELDGVTGAVVATLDSGAVRKVTYANGRVVKVNSPNSLAGNITYFEDSLGNRTNFAYANNNLGVLNKRTDALGRETSYGNFTYPRYNYRQITHPDSSTEIWTRTGFDLPLTHTDEEGRVTSWTYDAKYRVSRIDHPDGSHETFTYNSFDQVLTHRLRNGGTETNVYDGRGLKTSFTDAENNTTTYTYVPAAADPLAAGDKLASMTDPRGHTTTFEYDERGLPVKQTFADANFVTMDYDDFGNRLARTNELGHTWSWVYDNYRRVVEAADPLNRTTLTSYAVIGGGGCGSCNVTAKPTQITSPAGRVTTFTYDTEWRLLDQTAGFGTADAATTQYAYDAVGNRTQTTDPRGKVWTSTYDNRDRRVSLTDPLNQTTGWTYDAVGSPLTSTHPDGGVTTNVYDVMKRVVIRTDPKNQTTAMTYDASNNLTALTDARNNTYSFEYDLLNRGTKFIYPDSSYEQWTYNDTANASTPMLVYRGRDASTMSYIYDNRNRETACDYSDANTPDATKTYDAAGRLLTCSTSVSTCAYTYDIANQLLSETQTPAALGTGFTVGYTYDPDGNRASLTYPEASVVDYTYTNRNQLKEVIADGPPPLVAYTYDLNGNRTAKALENGTSASYTYDNASRLTQVKHVRNTTVVAQFDYTLNSVDNRTQKAITGAIPNRTEDYDYDAIDQVTSVDYGPRDEAFNYDTVGNRTSVVDSSSGTTNYTSNNLNQYTAVGVVTPTHDSKGNLSGYGSWTYGYDSKNRLKSAADGTMTASFAYDCRNRQVFRTINGTTIYFVYDNWNLIAEYDATGALQQRYVHGSLIDKILAKIDSAGAVYYLRDGSGSTVALTDSSGSLVESYQYDVFGKATTYDGSGTAVTATAHGNRFLFTGREWIQEVGFYDYRNRVYSQELVFRMINSYTKQARAATRGRWPARSAFLPQARNKNAVWRS